MKFSDIETMSPKNREDFEVFVKNHCYAVAYKDLFYDLYDYETKLVEVLLQKVVLLREKPLKEA